MSYKKKKSAAPAIILVAVLVIVLAVAMMVFWAPEGGGIISGIKDDILGGDNAVQNSNQLELIDQSSLPDATTPVQQTDEQGDTVVTFNGSEISVEGQGATASGNTLLIVQSGIYRLSGTLTDGRIVVSAKGQDVVLILDGVNVTCSDSSPLYVYKAASVTLLLNKTTENVFTDGEQYNYSLEYCSAPDEEPDACIFSKGDLIIRGTGSLKVNANFNSGIISKDTLKIINTTVDVTAKNNGINGKDSLTVQNSTVKVSAAGDCLRSTQENDSSLGWASLTDSNIYLSSTGGDCVQTERGITIENCSMSLTAGSNGADSAPSDSSLKGIKSNLGGITVNSGAIVINTADDAFHAAGDIKFNGGTLSIATGDDAVHSDLNIYINGGRIEMPDCHEGLEGALIEISGGEVYIIADDDGINASGGNDSSGETGMMGMFESDGSYLGISGGFVYINSQGDGIDSNGDIYMSGGTLIVSGPVSDGDGAIDYNGDFYMDGGILFAAGSKGMAQAPDNPNANTLSVSFDETVKSGSYISISGGGKEYVFRTDKDIGNIVFSAPDLTAGETYTVSYGGKYSGETNYCVCEGGSYSGGTELTSMTLTEGLNTYGTIGIGGTRGGQMFGEAGRFGGMKGEGKQNPMGGMGSREGEMNGNGRPPEIPEGMDGQPPEPPEGSEGQPPEIPGAEE